MMDGITSLDRLRLQGLRILVCANWLWTLVIAIGSSVFGGGHDLWALLLSVTVNIVPTLMVLRRQLDMEARLAMGTLAAVQPAIGVYLLSGHIWQMDGHMFFFAALAGLALLYDWRPIVLSATLIAIHHLTLNFLMPNWVFLGGSDTARVAIHAVAVICEAIVLCYLTIRLRLMLVALDGHVNDSGKLAAEAQIGREVAEAAMAARREADARAARLRQEQEEEKLGMASRRRAETMALVQDFQQSVAGIVSAVSAATHELDESARMLNDLAGRASVGTVQTVAVAEQSSQNAAMLAHQIDQLSESIAAIAAAAHQQSTLGGEAQRVSSAGHHAVRDLEGRTASIAGFANSITDIAARTNLLALNATIEAARAGEVGRGFAVVAGEVKQLAGQAASATGEIHALAGSAQQGAGIAQTALSDVTEAVRQLAEAADAIQSAVVDQRDATSAIGQSARDTARDATLMTRQMEGVAGVARDTENLSGRVSSAASGLLRTAQNLQKATDLFVSQLKAA